MSTLYTDCAQTVQRLHDALLALQRAGQLLQPPALESCEWFELLRQKLLPQLRDDAFLVVAVVGGTNIGKSVVFNHVAGYRASATSPLASGTKHPVCLAPPGFTERHDLEEIFRGFHLEAWTSSEAALEERAEHGLFWQTSDHLPENLLILDTPDIDSDAQVNWQRADHIRRCADVLIAVLTQQKYNDAAVKQFFRKAAAEDKVVIVVFNQCQLPEDDDYWPLWLETFCRETHVRPEFVYIAPNDRRAAEQMQLSFYERHWRPEGPGDAERPRERSPGDDRQTAEPAGSLSQEHEGPAGEGRNLAEDLSLLRFTEIKLRTLRGSMQHLLDREAGVPAYLRELEGRSGRFRSAAELLAADRLAKTDDWPLVPNGIMIQEIRRWWQTQREGWSKAVHGTYNTLGQGLAWPFRYARNALRGQPPPPLEDYRKQEWSAILQTVDRAYERLTYMSELGNPLLSARLAALLDGLSRTELLEKLKAEHDQSDLEGQLHQLVAGQMGTFRAESPHFYQFIKRLDQMAAAVRPAMSVVLFVTGFGPGGGAAAHVMMEGAVQTALHVVGDVAGGTVTAAVGDTAVSKTAAGGMGYMELKFRKLHAAYVAQRLAWLLEAMDRHVWGTMLEEINRGAGFPQAPEFCRVQAALTELEQQLKTEQQVA